MLLALSAAHSGPSSKLWMPYKACPDTLDERMTRRRLNWYDEMHHISYLAIEGGSRMFTKSEAFYDAIYGTMKDYAVEAQQIHALIQQYKQSSGTTLLDVACGTGRHLPFLREHYTLEGLDLDEQMLAIARQRNPEVVFHHADMADFDLGRRFDAIVCLFSSIGYVKPCIVYSRRCKRCSATCIQVGS